MKKRREKKEKGNGKSKKAQDMTVVIGGTCKLMRGKRMGWIVVSSERKGREGKGTEGKEKGSNGMERKGKEL